jgi:hypothetical protein
MKTLVLAVGICVVGASAAVAMDGTTNSTAPFKALAQVQTSKPLTEAQLAKIEGQQAKNFFPDGHHFVFTPSGNKIKQF